MEGKEVYFFQVVYENLKIVMGHISNENFKIYSTVKRQVHRKNYIGDSKIIHINNFSNAISD